MSMQDLGEPPKLFLGVPAKVSRYVRRGKAFLWPHGPFLLSLPLYSTTLKIMLLKTSHREAERSGGATPDPGAPGQTDTQGAFKLW